MAGSDKLTATPRLFVAADLSAGTEVSATAAQAHYLGTVLRRGAGDTVRLFNGRDGEWAASLVSIRRDRASFSPLTQLRAQSATRDLWLAFAMLKRDATDLVVQKATELGASVLLPISTERTNVVRLNLERLGAIATEAAEQSERLCVPAIRPPVTLPHFLAAWPAERPLAAAIERGAPSPVPAAASLLIGPEGGFSAAEMGMLTRAAFVSPIWLGPLVLRAETAALAGLALLQAPAWRI